MPRRSAFTLMEVMVVISLLVLLISMILPSFRQSKKNARAVICLSSVRQMALGTDAYSVDNRDYYPPYDNPGGTLRYETFWMTVFDPYHRDDRIRDCPETVEDPRVWGTAKVRWGPAPGSFIGKHTGSFGWNSWLHAGTTSGATAGYFGGKGKVPQQSLTPMFTDSSWVDFWPRVTDPWPPSLELGSQAGESSMGRVTVERHDFTVSVAMVDTSAHRIPMPQLWSDVFWHVGYQPGPAPPLP